MNYQERQGGRGRIALVLALLVVGGYLAVARWKALYPGPNAPRVTGSGLDLMWWR